MNFIYSPSNMMDFRGCPRRFYGRYITKEIAYRESPQTRRGQKVHEKIEYALHRGAQYVQWDDSKLHMDFIYKHVNNVLLCKEKGCTLLLEQEMIINKDKEIVKDWGSPDAWIRARADAILLPPEGGRSMSIIDIKTGKMWDKDDFQLKTYAYIASHIYDVDRINFVYWYVDEGVTARGSINLKNNLEEYFSPVLSVLNDMDISIRDNFFKCQKNKFCRWCSFYKNEEKCDIR